MNGTRSIESLWKQGPLFVTLLEQARRFAEMLAWLPPTLARLGVGWVFAQSGWGKLHNLEQVTGFFTDLGLPAPGFHAVLVSTTELVCGSLVLIGFATRLAAVPLIVTMIVAIRTALWADVDSLGALFGLLVVVPAVKAGFLVPKRVWDFADVKDWPVQWCRIPRHDWGSAALRGEELQFRDPLAAIVSA